MAAPIKDTHQKALALNLDNQVYGTFAEIGAGQETARSFFRAGGAAGTVAKTISAYDMTFSDAIYGATKRFVSRERLVAMLDHEYQLLLERLDKARGEHTRFFAFANTVAARSYMRNVDGHGWLGIRFQSHPRAAPSQIDIHVNLHGKQNLQDQETLGVIGVNLIYGAMHLHDDADALLNSIMDQLYPELVEVDMIEFSGPAFGSVDNRLMALHLVQRGMSNAALFTADRHIVQVADTLWKKAVIVERSRFRPPTLFTMDLLDKAQQAFMHDTQMAPEDTIVLSEMTLSNLVEDEQIDVRDFLHRADILCALGKNVLISNYGEFYRLAQYLFRYTSLPIAIAMGLPSLRELFNERYYEHLPGGILESFGRLFKHDLRLYVSPELDSETGRQRDIHGLEVDEHLRHLYVHLLKNNYIRSLETIEADYLSIHSHEVLRQLRTGTPGWEDKLPAAVVDIIKEHHLFDWEGASA